MIKITKREKQAMHNAIDHLLTDATALFPNPDQL